MSEQVGTQSDERLRFGEGDGSLPSLGTRPGLKRGHPVLTLVAIAFGVIMVGLDATVVVVANPYIARALHGSLSDMQWVMNAYLLVLAVLFIPMGMLGDRYGRRAVFLVGLVGFALSSLAVGEIGSMSGVIAFRAVQGIFGAIILPNTLGILRNNFPTEKLNQAIGIWGSASAMSIAAGPIVAGLLVEHVSWESVFYINVPVGAVAVVVGLLVLTESRDPHPRAFDWTGLAALAGGQFCIVFAIVKAESWGWGDAKTLAFIAGGLVLLVALALIELRVKTPLLPPSLFAKRSLTLGVTSVMLALFAMYGVLFYLTLYLENVHGYDPVAAGVRLLPLTMLFFISAPLGAFLNDRLGPRFAIPFGMACLTVAMLALSLPSQRLFLRAPLALLRTHRPRRRRRARLRHRGHRRQRSSRGGRHRRRHPGLRSPTRRCARGERARLGAFEPGRDGAGLQPAFKRRSRSAQREADRREAPRCRGHRTARCGHPGAAASCDHRG